MIEAALAVSCAVLVVSITLHVATWQWTQKRLDRLEDKIDSKFDGGGSGG